MKYKLEINKPKSGPNKDDIILSITDIQLHTVKKRQGSIGKTIKQSVEKNQPGRIYSNMKKNQGEKSTLESLLLQDPDLVETIRKYNKQGKRIFIKVLKDVPLLTGKDTNEFVKSKRGKRIIRGLAKNKEGDKI